MLTRTGASGRFPHLHGHYSIIDARAIMANRAFDWRFLPLQADANIGPLRGWGVRVGGGLSISRSLAMFLVILDAAVVLFDTHSACSMDRGNQKSNLNFHVLPKCGQKFFCICTCCSYSPYMSFSLLLLLLLSCLWRGTACAEVNVPLCKKQKTKIKYQRFPLLSLE